MNAELDPARRRFLTSGALVAGGLVVNFLVPATARFAAAMSADSSPARVGQTVTEPGPLPPPNSFVRIGSDNVVTVLLAHSEMGQGIWTGLAMLIADELDADWSSVRVEHAPADAIYKSPVYHIQMTGGSSSTRSEFDRYRQVGALARGLLLQAAAQRLRTPVETLRTENGAVLFGEQRVSYGELAEAAAALPAPATVTLKRPEQWRLIGKPTKRLDSPEKITGRARFGLDVQFPGLLTAMVARSPVFGGKVKRFDADRAKALPGVRAVVQVPTGVAVVADHYWAAKQGRDALDIEWDLSPEPTLDTDALRARYRALTAGEGIQAAKQGDVAGALAKAGQVLEAEYTVPYLSHTPMEPLNCTVRLDADACEIWVGTQWPEMDQGTAAYITGLKPEQITIHIPFLGGGFGRRGPPGPDFTAEAVEVAKAAGLPVKTVWAREDDIRGGFYRPLVLHKLRVGLGADGLPAAWRHTVVGQSISRGTPLESHNIKHGIDRDAIEGVPDSPYLEAVPDTWVDCHMPELSVPVLWWRSVSNSHTGFVMESAIDELAHAAGQDPLAYRRRLLAKHPRHLAALNLAAEKAAWGAPLPVGHARGIAVHGAFGSFAAEVAEVSIEQHQIRVHRVVCAIDCGLVVNPAGVQAQMESAVVFGLSAALYGRLDIKDGRVQQSNFHDYRILRINETPRIEVHIVPSVEKMGGVGEPGVPPIAPAVANALFALTGQRLRALPLSLPG